MYNDIDIQVIESSLNYIFHNKGLLLEALSHPSLNKTSHENYKDYERLELLGDTVLNLIITEELINRFKKVQEGKLAQIRAYLVSRDIIAKVAECTNIAQYIIMSHGEETSGGRNNISNVENVIEALIAAIYKDGGLSICREWVLNLWHKYMNDSLNASLEFDPKSRLQELTQSLKLGIPKYTVLKISGLDHAPLFTVEAKVAQYISISNGNTKKAAEKSSAQELLQQIKSKINNYQV